MTAKAPDPSDLGTWNLSGVVDVLRRMARPEVAFTGWDWVAGIERQRGRGAAAREAYREAWGVLPETSRAEWPVGVAAQYWTMRAELTADDRRLLREGLEAVYLPVFEATAARDDFGEMVDEERYRVANQIGALARGWFLAGQRQRALDAAELAAKMTPDNEEITRLLQEMRT